MSGRKTFVACYTFAHAYIPMDLELNGWTWPPRLTLPEWGRLGWAWLHTLAITYPRRPIGYDQRVVGYRIWNFVSHLPCWECRQHATQFVLSYPPDTRSTHTLQRWAWNFHNAVNLRLGKPLVSFSEYQRIYARAIQAAGAY